MLCITIGQHFPHHSLTPWFTDSLTHWLIDLLTHWRTHSVTLPLGCNEQENKVPSRVKAPSDLFHSIFSLNINLSCPLNQEQDLNNKHKVFVKANWLKGPLMNWRWKEKEKLRPKQKQSPRLFKINVVVFH